MDFLEEGADGKVKAWLGGKADVILSDMAASSSGHKQTDHLRIVALCEAAADLAFDVLGIKGAFVAKVLAGGAEGTLQTELKRRFGKVANMKPPASRSDSSERFVVATDFEGDTHCWPRRGGMALSAFKTYDIRGRVGKDLDEGIAYRIGRAFAKEMRSGQAILGRDARDTSPMLASAIACGLVDEGIDVADIGLCGTEEVSFATDHLGADGGVMVTASHNPKGDNGAKLIGPGARPVARESGLARIEARVEADDFGEPAERGRIERIDTRAAYVERILSFIDPAALRPLKVLVNAGNGAAGPTFDAIAQEMASAPVDFARIHHEPDPAFPNGIPNPLLPENRQVTGDAVLAHGADIGVAWDGDFDRCFLFDETGGFVDGEYIVGLLSAAMLARHPGAKIVHDARVMWNTRCIVAEKGGDAVVSRTGHALMKEKMREVDAAYGGEMSAHHYFRDFMCCDSGMIPWLLVLGHMSATGQPLSALVDGMRRAHPSSGEINFRLSEPEAAVAAIEAEFAGGAAIDPARRLSASFADWRFNLRRSNTEPVVRLNVETRGDPVLLGERTAALSEALRRFA